MEILLEKNIPLFKVFMSEKVLEPVNNVLMSGFVGQGPMVEQFEEKLRLHFKTKNLVTVNSGTSALFLALHMLKQPSAGWAGLSQDDEVLTTALTCTATNFPILANNLNIKWVDVDANTCNMDLADLEAKLSPRTKVIMLVHWGGYPHDLDRVEQIRDRCQQLYGFRPRVIQDGAHSFGSRYKGELLGTQFDYFTMYSFQAIKHFTTVDGGLLILPDQPTTERAKLLRWYGINRNSRSKDFRCEDDIAEWGFKLHMNDLNAVIGLHNFQPAMEKAKVTKDNSIFYDSALQDVSGVTLLGRHSWADSASWLYTMHVERREDFMDAMKEAGIMVSQVHARNDQHSCLDAFETVLPSLNTVTETMICIPSGWWVTSSDRDYIVDVIKKGW